MSLFLPETPPQPIAPELSEAELRERCHLTMEWHEDALDAWCLASGTDATSGWVLYFMVRGRMYWAIRTGADPNSPPTEWAVAAANRTLRGLAR